MATLVMGKADRAHRSPAPPAIEPAPAAGMVDCGFCGAPNGAHREGCFNCGGLLQSRKRAGDLVRLPIGGDGRPGRVVYARVGTAGHLSVPHRA
jgi:hypothetical protein